MAEVKLFDNHSIINTNSFGKVSLSADKNPVLKNSFVVDKNTLQNSYDCLFKKFTPGVKKVIYNNPATIVFWSDGTKTTSKCDNEDTFDEMTGFLLCIAKKYMGGERLKFSLEKNVYKKEK